MVALSESKQRACEPWEQKEGASSNRSRQEVLQSSSLLGGAVVA